MSFSVALTNTLPTITEKHRQDGILPRYFAAKANHIDKQVFEITHRAYYNLYDNRYIILGNLNWRIRGRLEDNEMWVYTGNHVFNSPDHPQGTEPITIPGLLTQNRAAVMFLGRKIPAVKNYLTNYEQFYVGE